jgi:hypothetical protein
MGVLGFFGSFGLGRVKAGASVSYTVQMGNSDGGSDTVGFDSKEVDAKIRSTENFRSSLESYLGSFCCRAGNEVDSSR